MTPQRRAEGLAAAARTLRGELVEAAEQVARTAAVDLVSVPAAASVMLELSSPVGDFCLTEVVVTTAEVRIAGRSGWGCVLGFDEEAALAGAILDATPAAGADRLAERALALEADHAAAEARAVATTRVETGPVAPEERNHG